jgi:prepilin signal peptidase PulO-like enzyme (type II secretory pathway)
LIELACAVLFSLVGYFGIGGVWGEMDKIWALPYLLVVFSLLVAVFVIDLENQFIPDSVSLFLFSLNLVLFPVFLNGVYYEYLFAGFLAASILLFIHILTRGKGMGLGDSKLALSVGSFFSLKYSIAWLFLSFLLGAVVGIFLILLRKASLKEKLAFGPFLVISFFAMMLFGDHIFLLLFPGWK